MKKGRDQMTASVSRPFSMLGTIMSSVHLLVSKVNQAGFPETKKAERNRSDVNKVG